MPWLKLLRLGESMKQLKLFLALIALVGFSACQKSDGDSQAQPMNAQCVNNPQLCQGNLYHQSPGFQPYGYGGYGYGYNGYNNYGYGGYYNNYGYQNPFNYMNNTAYLCSCPAGSVPTYNMYAGLGCVQTSQIYGYGYAYFGYGPDNQHWINIPQISNHTGYSNSGCYNGVVQSCIVDQANSCSAGYTCRSQSAGSRMGLCVSNSAANGGYQPVR